MIMQLADTLYSLHYHGGTKHSRSGAQSDVKAANVLVQRMPSWWPSDTLLLSFSPTEDKDEPVLRSGDDWDPLCDVFSFGLLCCEILSGEVPEASVSTYQARYDLGYGAWSGLRPGIRLDAPQALQDIINRCWHPDPNARPSFADIVALLEQVPNYHLAHTSLKAAWSFLETPPNDVPRESDLHELYNVVLSHSDPYQSFGVEINGVKYLRWASDFVSTAKIFYGKHWQDSRDEKLPFASFVQIWSLLLQMRHHMRGYFAHTPKESLFLSPFVTRLDWDCRAEEAEVMVRMAKLYEAFFESMKQVQVQVQADPTLTFNQKLAMMRAAGFLWVDPMFWERFSDDDSERLRLAIRKDADRRAFMRSMASRACARINNIVPILCLVPLLYVGYLLFWLFGGNWLLFKVSGYRVSGFREVLLGYMAIQVLGLTKALFCFLGWVYGWQVGLIVYVAYIVVMYGLTWGLLRLSDHRAQRFFQGGLNYAP